MVERNFSLDGDAPSGGNSGEGYVAELGNGGTGADSLGAVTLGDNDTGGDSGDDFTFDPERHISRDRTNADGSYRRKRRRKDGTTRSTASPQRTKTRADYSASLDALSNTLMIVHAGLASVSKVPELEIDKEESKVLATSVANVLAEFDITPDPKAQAIVGLIIAMGSIYGPRMYLYNERMKIAKSPRKGPAQVHPLGGTILEQ
jgi:hypothetical protein